jgi:hypothetical protein
MMASFRTARRPVVAFLAGVLIVGSAGYAFAQLGRSRGVGFEGGAGGWAPQEFPDGDFVICRLMYNEVRQFGVGWRTDYPLGERNLSTRFRELTRTRVSQAPDGSVNPYVVRLSDDQLFQCPFLMAGDIGSIGLTDADAKRLREYLLKGGFLWVDDMWGPDHWDAWAHEVSKVFPPSQYPIVDVPLTDPIFHSQFALNEMPQIPNIGHWRRSGNTSELGPDSAVPVFRAIRDDHGRIMIAITHNTDIADAFEREADDPRFFLQFSPRGYALGVNVILHAMTH